MDQSDLLRIACTTLDQLRIRHLVTGSQATIAFGDKWGHPWVSPFPFRRNTTCRYEYRLGRRRHAYTFAQVDQFVWRIRATTHHPNRIPSTPIAFENDCDAS
jgi:hypothetical protein